jgi:hypothetical protein
MTNTELPPTTPLTPEQQDFTKLREMHDAGLELGGAKEDNLGRLVLTAVQLENVSQKYNDGLPVVQHLGPIKQMDPTSERQPQHVNEELENHENMTPERLEEIAMSSFYAAMPYAIGNKDLAYSPLGERNVREELRDIFDGLKQRLPLKKTGKDFVEAGVAEVVTLAKPEDFDFSKGSGAANARDHQIREFLTNTPWQIGEHAGEEIYVLQYAITRKDAEGKIKYEYKDQGAERDSDFNYTMLLPESQAKELAAAMQADPNLARKLGDVLVFNENAVGTYADKVRARWHDPQYKPPYEVWREVNGGVSRMAFRTASDQSVEQATVVKF